MLMHNNTVRPGSFAYILSVGFLSLSLPSEKGMVYQDCYGCLLSATLHLVMAVLFQELLRIATRLTLYLTFTAVLDWLVSLAHKAKLVSLIHEIFLPDGLERVILFLYLPPHAVQLIRQQVRNNLPNYVKLLCTWPSFFTTEYYCFRGWKTNSVRKPYLLPCRRHTHRGTQTESVKTQGQDTHSSPVQPLHSQPWSW